MIQSFKQNMELSDQYDAIVIGSGLGGLSTAAILSKEGKKVLVLERHYTAGGYTHVFKRREYEWDVGIHYIGEVHREKSLTRKLFDYITDEQLKWAEMGDIYDRVVIGDSIYNFPKGVANFKKQMIEYFPGEAIAIQKYVDLVFKVSKKSRGYFVEKAMSPILSFLIGRWMRKPFLDLAKKTTREVLSGLTNNERLIKVLTAQFGDYGLVPAKSSFAIHAFVAKHYFEGGCFPVGGSSRIVDTIDPIIERSGGTILVKAEVRKIVIEKGEAIGVQMENGKTFYSPKIISNAGIINTYGKLIDPAISTFPKLAKQLQQVKPSVGHLALYLGFNGTSSELKLPKSNYWVFPEEGTHESNVELYSSDIQQNFPVVYISFPSAKDPDWERRYPSKSTVEIITMIPDEVFQPWAETGWKKRGKEYEELKASLSERLLEKLFDLEPHLQDKLDYCELSTPLSTKHFMNYSNGEIYGIDHTPDRFTKKFLRPRTQIKNLFLTGQDIITAGIASVLFSGLLTASVIEKKNLLNKIIHKQ